MIPHNPSQCVLPAPVEGISRSTPTSSPHATHAPDEGIPWTPLALLLEEDDQFFSEKLPDFIKTAEFGPHAGTFWHPGVQARLDSLSDSWFTVAVLPLAYPDALGLNILFDDRLLGRIAIMGETHFNATFLPYAERIPGFTEKRFSRVLQRYRQTHPTAVPVTDASTRRRAVRQSARTILAKEISPLAYVVEDLLPAGCTLLVGKSKDGKSLMAYDLAVAVASGGKALGRYDVMKGSVWYLALEDGERRVQDRLRLMEDRLETSLPEEAQDKLEFTVWDAPRLGEGLEDDIREWIETTPDARLLIIDILEKVRPLRKQHGNLYAEDYASTATLTELAQKRNVAILVVHHSNKANSEDFRDAPSGCMSLLGGADNLWMLRRMPLSEEATLNVTGRDIREPQHLPMQFREGYWTVMEADAHRLATMSEERRAILHVIATSPTPLTPKEIATRLEKNRSTTRVLIAKLVQQGLLIAVTPDHYSLASHSMHTQGGEPEQEGINTINSVNTINTINTINSSESAPDPHSPSVPPVYEEPLPVYGEPGECKQPQPFEKTSDSDLIPPVLPVFTVFTTTSTPLSQPPVPTNGHQNGSEAQASPPQYCPGCGERPCWLERGDYYQCSRRGCGAKVPKTPGTSHG